MPFTQNQPTEPAQCGSKAPIPILNLVSPATND
jgi:hypothetical protein